MEQFFLAINMEITTKENFEFLKQNSFDSKEESKNITSSSLHARRGSSEGEGVGGWGMEGGIQGVRSQPFFDTVQIVPSNSSINLEETL